ncbi:MAG: glycan-binding surface protein [Segatella copri]
MKIKNINGALFAVALAAVSAGFTSCEDEPDKYEVAGGTPTIDYVRPVDAASKDSLLTEASLNNTICIVGRNLRSVTQINFNDQAAVLNTSYMTDNTIIVTVPKNIPGKVTDKIYFITNNKDTLDYDFKTVVPAPTINGMSNEWAAPGEEVTIKGDYFLDYDDSHLTIKVGDNYTIPYEDLKISLNSIRFNMPEDMPKHEPITITTINGTTKAGFRYMDNRGMLFDFDTPWKEGGEVLGNNGWHNRTITSDGTSLSGNYMVLGETAMGSDGKWNDGNFSFEYWPGSWQDPETYSSRPRMQDLADFSDWKNMSLKFEMCIPKDNSWSAAPMQIYFGSVAQVSLGNAGVKDIYGNVLAGANNTFLKEQGKLARAIYMPWQNTEDKLYNTEGKWVTVTIPLANFIYDFDGNKGLSYSGVNDFSAFNIFIVKGAYNDANVFPTGVDCNPIIKIDNIRVVPNK